MKKRIISLALAVALIFALASPALAADENDPIIMIAGFVSTQMFENPASDERVHVWDLDYSLIGSAVLKELPALLGGAVLYAVTGRSKVIGDAFARAADNVVGFLALHPDGAPAHDVGPWPGTAADFSLAAIRAKRTDDPNARYLQQLGSFCTRFEQQVGADSIFIFQYDWRDPTVLNAEKLRGFIKEVLEITGSEKARLFGSSYGGQICGAYLHDYAQEGQVSKIVMEFPALGGSSMIPDLFIGRNFSLQTEALTRFIQSYVGTETKLEPILKWFRLRALYPLLTDLLQAGLLPVARTWGGLWDLMPADQYDEAKAAALKPGERYAWEAYCDKMHHEVMPKIGQTLMNAQETYGIAIRIVANTGSPHLLGPEDINSDGLLDVQYTTGAKALPLGQHGISQSNSICEDSTHKHVSPGQDIDASAAWLPENTWFVQGQFHGASYLDPYALELECALMLDPDLNTVFDDPAYPQFGLCRQATESIALAFGGAHIQIDNLSRERDVKILKVTAPGLKFGQIPGGKLAPGASVTVTCTENATNPGTYTPITVTFLQYTGVAPVPRVKTFDFTA